MQFIILGYDGTDADAANRRALVREAHIALCNQERDAGNLLYGAAMLNDAGKMCGSMMVANFPTREALDEWLSREPYVTGGVWKKIDVIPCAVGPSFQNLRPS